MFEVKIVETETGNLVSKFKFDTGGGADRCALGLSRNLNHDEFHIDIREVEND